jgi:hypothetical protein
MSQSVEVSANTLDETEKALHVQLQALLRQMTLLGNNWDKIWLPALNKATWFTHTIFDDPQAADLVVKAKSLVSRQVTDKVSLRNSTLQHLLTTIRVMILLYEQHPMLDDPIATKRLLGLETEIKALSLMTVSHTARQAQETAKILAPVLAQCCEGFPAR